MFIDKCSVSGEDFYLKLNYFCGDPFMNWQVSRAHGVLPLVQAIVRDGEDRHRVSESTRTIRTLSIRTSSEVWYHISCSSFTDLTYVCPLQSIGLSVISYLCVSTSLNQLTCQFILTYTCTHQSTSVFVISYLLTPAHFTQPTCRFRHTDANLIRLSSSSAVSCNNSLDFFNSEHEIWKCLLVPDYRLKWM